MCFWTMLRKVNLKVFVIVFATKSLTQENKRLEKRWKYKTPWTHKNFIQYFAKTIFLLSKFYFIFYFYPALAYSVLFTMATHVFYFYYGSGVMFSFYSWNYIILGVFEVLDEVLFLPKNTLNLKLSVLVYRFFKTFFYIFFYCSF